MPETGHDTVVTGRCYCGAFRFSVAVPPQIVTYCHCTDCKRWTGAPAPAFAAFDAALFPLQSAGAPVETNPGVKRWNCASCGTPLAAQFDYLPGQTYVPLGLLDDIDRYPPTLHCHAAAKAAWLAEDDLPRADGTGRATLKAAP